MCCADKLLPRPSLSKKWFEIVIKRVFYVSAIVVTVVSCQKYDQPIVAPCPIYDFPDNKLWAHRVNTAREARFLLGEFNGVEIDVFYMPQQREFQTGHDSPSGISLAAYLDSIKDPGRFYYWLDFKNLSPTNVVVSCAVLQAIIDTFNLQRHVIVESSEASPLSYFKKSGIFTSYWVTDISGNSFPYFRERQLHKEVYENLSRHHFDALSSSYNMCPFLHKYFENYNIHVWTNGLSGKSDEQFIADLSRYRDLKVILVDYQHNFLSRRRNFNHKDSGF